MGTSTMGSDIHSDKQEKILKLQARKKELESLLAAKNEELYKLCVQEVQFTGIMPLEVPLSPEVPQRERLGSVRSGDRSEGNDVQDGSDTSSRRLRAVSNDRVYDIDHNIRKNISYRLSTPSISGISVKSAGNRRRPETSCSNFFPSPPQERNSDTFSLHASHTYPALADRRELNDHKHHTVTAEYSNKIYYTNALETHNVSKMKETHFSASHPDIAMHYPKQQQAVNPHNRLKNTPIIYQYASKLKSQNPHLGSLHHHQVQGHRRRPEGVRRNIQRTQTYHLTSHTDYNHSENIDNRAPMPSFQHRSHPDIQEQVLEHAPIERVIPVPNTLPLRERNTVRNIHTQLEISTDENKRTNHALSPVSHASFAKSEFDLNRFSPKSQDSRVKEKQWYETSLDSPTRSDSLRSPHLTRTSSVGNSQAYEIMVSSGRHSALQNPTQTRDISNSPMVSPGAISLESPKNMTIIEQGKCIPYREETKPFEMSDFYKYSTKFRQANVQKAPNPGLVHNLGYNKMPMELPQYAEGSEYTGQNK